MSIINYSLIILINDLSFKIICYISIVRYKIIRYKKFMPPDKPLYQ